MSTKEQDKPQQTTYKLPIKQICIAIFASYLVLAVAFYFLAGEQLRFRQSRGNLELLPAISGTVELIKDTSIEEYFVPKIQLIEKVSVQLGTYNRTNTGTVVISLVDVVTGRTLISRSFDASKITEGEVVELSTPKPIEGLYGKQLLLSVTSPDSLSGSAVSPMMAAKNPAAGERLYINGNVANGDLCFSITGQDHIWTGLHYWKFISVGAFLLILYLSVILYKDIKGKKSLVINAIAAVRKYRFLINQLVSRDFKTKYKRSILGVLWSFLNPLLMMSVQYFVFANIFKMNIDYYPVYLLSGIIIFNFFSEACGMTLMSIIGNASLITKVYIPKYIYPLSRVLSSLINLLISLIPLLGVIIFSGISITTAYLLIPFELICLVIFSLGLGMLLSAAMVFFRDTQFLWGVLSMIWMYATPIFYPESILPASFAIILKINPLYHFIKFIRICILNGVSPEPLLYVQSFLIALGMLLIGAFVFKKSQDKFILYI